MKWIATPLLLAALAAGCHSPSGKPASSESAAVIAKYLPTDAKNIKDVGNNWYTFEAPIEGWTRTFMIHWNAASGGASYFDSFSELRK